MLSFRRFCGHETHKPSWGELFLTPFQDIQVHRSLTSQMGQGLSSSPGWLLPIDLRTRCLVFISPCTFPELQPLWWGGEAMLCPAAPNSCGHPQSPSSLHSQAASPRPLADTFPPWLQVRPPTSSILCLESTLMAHIWGSCCGNTGGAGPAWERTPHPSRPGWKDVKIRPLGGNVTSIVPRALSPSLGPQPSCLPWDLMAALSLASSPALASLSPLHWSTLSWSTSPVSQEAEVCFWRQGTKVPLPPPCKSCLKHRGSLSCLRS